MIQNTKAIQETTLRGSPDCPFEFYHIDKNHAKFAMRFHYHLDCEILRVLKGSFTLYINEHQYSLTKGQYVFIESGRVHGGRPDDDECVYECVVFDLNLMFDEHTPGSGWLKKISEHRVKLNECYSEQNDREITKTFDQVFDSLKHKCCAPMIYGSMLQMLGTIIDEQAYTSLTANVSGNYVKQFGRLPLLFRYMYDNFSREITLEEMADTMDLSPKYFCRFFKKITGRRPVEYLNRFRLECAAIRLVTESESINEIAYSCGFKDPCYFAKSFKSFKGMSPSEYRSCSTKNQNASHQKKKAYDSAAVYDRTALYEESAQELANQAAL
ncbi:MAG TPA: hypothetical protein DCR21_01760 [Succinivibrionaceae bacterium]|nr:AraC family transcriptional regulator [Succinivibrio sp.]HAR79534.1 hypothetical protein [Succinivibrionaceae bacterium]